jgi:hypothetical protein
LATLGLAPELASEARKLAAQAACEAAGFAEVAEMDARSMALEGCTLDEACAAFGLARFAAIAVAGLGAGEVAS